MTTIIGRRRKDWHVEVEEEDSSFTIIAGRYAGQMDMAHSLMSAEKNPRTYIAMIQKELFQRCVTSHKMFANPLDTHVLTGETYDIRDSTHILISELDDDAQRSLLWTIAPFMKEMAEKETPEQQEGQALAERFRQERPHPDNESGENDRQDAAHSG